MNDGSRSCFDCVYCIDRPDMKGIKMCVKHHFPILNPELGCVTHERRITKNENTNR